MNSFLTRLNGVFSFTLSALAAVTIVCYLSTVMKERLVSQALVKTNPTYNLQVKHVYNPQTKINNDLVELRLSIDADFSSLFDWNVKQLFVYVVATFPTDNHPVNEVVLWDKIIQRGDQSVVKLPSVPVEYHLLDHGTGLRGHNNVTLQLCWNVVPLAGQLLLVKSPVTHFTIPERYTS